MKSSKKQYKTIDEYLYALPNQTRETLETLRRTIKKTAPEATEGISYRIPVFKYKGRFLVGFAAFKDHCSLFPGASAIETHKTELASYDTAKGTIRFPIEKPLPKTLVTKLIRTRIADIEKRVRKQKTQQ